MQRFENRFFSISELKARVSACKIVRYWTSGTHVFPVGKEYTYTKHIAPPQVICLGPERTVMSTVPFLT